MATNDFLTQEGQISGTDISIQPSSGGTQFLSSFVQGILSGGGDKIKKEQEKLKYYTSLREAGYSPEQATARVNKQFGGNYLQKILGKNAAGFQVPTGTDKIAMEQEKLKSETEKNKAMTAQYTSGMTQEKTRSEIERNKAQAARYNRLGSSGALGKDSASVYTKRMEYLKGEIDDLESAAKKVPQGEPDLEAGARNVKLRAYKKAYNKLLLASGGDGSSDVASDETQPYVPGKTQVGQIFTHSNGKKYKVLDVTDPNDPGIEEVQ